MDVLKIEITGPGAEDAERELHEVLRAELGVAGRRVPSEAGEREPGRKIDPNTVAIIAVLVSLPSTIETTLNLAERVALTQKLKRLVAWARRRSAPGMSIKVVSPKGRSLDLDRAEPGDVVEILAEAGNDKAERKA